MSPLLKAVRESTSCWSFLDNYHVHVTVVVNVLRVMVSVGTEIKGTRYIVVDRLCNTDLIKKKFE